MRDHVYRFDFEPGAPLGEIRRSLQLAALAAEILHGPEAVRLDGARRFDKQARRCIIDGHAAAGRHLARLFTGFLTRQFGARSFRVIRLDGGFQDAVAELGTEEIRKTMRERR